jgi:hypothetical protein
MCHNSFQNVTPDVPNTYFQILHTGDISEGLLHDIREGKQNWLRRRWPDGENLGVQHDMCTNLMPLIRLFLFEQTLHEHAANESTTSSGGTEPRRSYPRRYFPVRTNRFIRSQ